MKTITTADLLADEHLLRAAERLRPDVDPVEVAARAAWSVLTEPGDGVAGALVTMFGAQGALDQALSDATLRAPVEALGARAMSEAASRWSPRADPRAVAGALRDAEAVGARMLLPEDPDWPAGLDDLGPHAPLMLWVRGATEALVAEEAVSIVGARASTAYGENIAAELAGDLAATGVSVVSGGAYGIDGTAHRAALGVGGTTVAFLAGGVDRSYPAGHHQLFERIRTGGAVVSEVPCGSAPTKWRFLQRNRLISATGLATVVIEAGRRSGTLNTAGHAAALGRPLGAVPGPVTSAASAGCHRLLREFDAICVTSAAEVRELWADAAPSHGATPAPDPDRIRLMDALSARAPRDVPDLAKRSGLSMERVRSVLGTLDLEGGVVRRATGWLRAGE
ncbi:MULTISPECIES: DNA-processing protein DprA [unclassified Microbacterium]|uniref:DNA-processing protein DprA n=1 Tax=unclassified Microbacterium TaxID=2609290 RepID=UPI0012FA2B8C|nr:DNA-processing protein DprA [Microbacterium sp. MAH-37]MVQ42356.1 DNA-protecting protein DprA [Microbacterium sp. MAH-37]